MHGHLSFSARVKEHGPMFDVFLVNCMTNISTEKIRIACRVRLLNEFPEIRNVKLLFIKEQKAGDCYRRAIVWLSAQLVRPYWLSSRNFFQGGIYCYANFFCNAIVFGPNFREGQTFSGGQTASGGRPPPPVEESQP